MSAWRLLADDGAGAADGLALDEALMHGQRRDAPPASPCLRLYTYDSHVALCGRYQHLEAEIDLDACRRTGTEFNRRPTGGGAIVMGSGQLGVAVVDAATAERPKQVLLRLSTGIVAGLAKLGIDAAFGGKNDLKVAGRKIAGLGLYLDGAGGLLFHASVLADLDIAFMLDVLDIPAAKLDGARAAAAVGQRVTTVTEETGEPWTGAALRDVVADGFRAELGIDLTPSEPAPAERERMEALIVDKYRTADWLHQRGPQPDATATSVLKTPGGLVRLYLALNGDTIKSALFAGDFNELPEPVARFEAGLKWARVDRDDLNRLAGAAFPAGTGLDVPAADLVDAVLAAAGRSRVTGEAAPDRTGSCYFPDRSATSEEEQ